MTANEPREIAFEDIRKGDDIEVQWQLRDALETRRGIAHRKTVTGWWLTERGEALVTPHDDGTIYRHHRPAPAEPEGLGAVIRWREREYIATNSTPGTYRWAWVNGAGDLRSMTALRWNEFDLDSIEVLPEGIEVES